jgi:hypothetical protein
MGVGPSLHGLLRVRRLASEDSGRFPVRPFLLIVRTGRLVTVRVFVTLASHSEVLVPKNGSAGCSDFPAYGRIYRQRVRPLSHACSSRITAGTDYTSTLFPGAGVL